MENFIETKSRLIEDPRQQAGQLIGESKNIYLIPSKEPEAITSTMALFYTLKELGKNVNLIIDDLPANLKFLTPSLDFISCPKNFVISIPNKVAKASQIFYEKNEEVLKIHLTLENGNIKKENISFYFSEAKPDLIITLGIKDYSEQLTTKLDSYGFLLDSPILNIDNEIPMTPASGILDGKVPTGSRTHEEVGAVGTRNKKFGKINLLGISSLTETVFNLIKNLDNGLAKKETNTCLLSGIIIYTDNFKNKVTANVFEVASGLMKNGADLGMITENIKIS